MSDNATPVPDSVAPSAGCCGPVAAERPAVEVSSAVAPCCGTAEGASAAETCCDPAARREAVAAGADCC
ncbi:hypothetical protein J5Y04_03945 [Kitasatospora sp. RG8]|uniref:hypothetical protein n=1 Tax=Kitasatospora sp. RG8 TaxID=2820815 RepID=UPI001ADF7901|nr:hypothetical protein [Kitasatospora sp. RG8]MBP0448695.1 hypothetical protein [Kitasatospora sp. RG8]